MSSDFSNSTPKLELWVETTDLVKLVPPSALPTWQTWQTWFEHWLRVLNPTASPIDQYEVSLLLTDDATIQRLNATYRHQDKPTDVLSFAAQDIELPGADMVYQTTPLPLGDVIISVETAQRQRHSDDFSLIQELAWLATHGLLHLLGWDHPDEDSLESMLKKQSHLLKLIAV